MIRPIIIIIIISCITICSCTTRVKHGFSYPQSVHCIDTSFYFSQEYLKIRDDSGVLTSKSEYLKKAGQMNLSIRPLKNKTLRLTYNRWRFPTVVITFTKDSIITVTDYNGTEVRESHDFNRCSTEESELLRIYYSEYNWNKNILDEKYSEKLLKERPEIQRAIIKNKRANDSLAKLFPKLIDTAYINHLIEKSKVKHFYMHTAEIIRKPMTEEQFAEINNLLDEYGFWTMKNTNGILQYLDGSSWILESNTKTSYYFVYSHKQSGPFNNLCEKLIKYID